MNIWTSLILKAIKFHVQISAKILIYFADFRLGNNKPMDKF